MTEDVVSKQTVKNTIYELEVELEEEIPVQKKKIKNLHIQADEDLWLEVQQYIYDNYDTEYLENVYIAGDGAPWIVAGCRVLGKSKFVLDKKIYSQGNHTFRRQSAGGKRIHIWCDQRKRF